jgi:peptidoglycan/xylan/chitin deacetylase (PgdA/CDA1 family)
MGLSNIAPTHTSILDVAIRLLRIMKRYGFSSKKMRSKLQIYLETALKHDATPTFLITANLLEKHVQAISGLIEMGAEFSIHGYDHVDYSKLTAERMATDLRKAVSLFRRNSLSCSGFRFPYLSYNQECLNQLGNSGIRWDSSFCVHWPVKNEAEYEERYYSRYKEMLSRYNYRNVDDCLSLPQLHNGILEIPVFLPDDDLLERLGITDKEVVARIWNEILEWTHSKGELFTLQLHPERVAIYKDALEGLLDKAKSLKPSIWLTSLGSLYEWCTERSQFSVRAERKAKNRFEIVADCTSRATVLVKVNSVVASQSYSGFRVMKERRFALETPKKPIVGVGKGFPAELLMLLESEGFPYEVNDEGEEYSVYLESPSTFTDNDRIKVLEELSHTSSPLVRFWRWPNECQSAHAITGDIDSMTLGDFLRRIAARR